MTFVVTIRSALKYEVMRQDMQNSAYIEKEKPFYPESDGAPMAETDLHRKLKFHIYQKLGVREYFIFDPTSDYIKDSPLIGFRLEDRDYVEMELKGDHMRSDELGLDLVIVGNTLRLFDPLSGKFLLTPEEEADARIRAEAEVERLRAEIESLKQKP
jgi:hypothetical protein